MDFATAFNGALSAIDDAVWGVPLIVLILAGGILLSIRLKGLQIRQLPRALRYMVKNEEGGTGEVSSFGALCTALSATIGTGNIVGVATAVVAGGPGALFWMFIAALFGMATKYSEGLLAVKYREVDKNTGHSLGGPFYYIEKGMGHKAVAEGRKSPWRWMAKLFAFFGCCVGLFGIGTFTQVNSINSASNTLVAAFAGMKAADLPAVFTIGGTGITMVTIVTSLIVAILVGLVVIGGLQRIAAVSEKVVPAMAIIYVLLCAVLIGCNITRLPDAFYAINVAAFDPQAIAGGIMGTFVIAMQKGIARGIFSNEAGLGSAPIAAAAAQTHEPTRQGLVTMTGTFIDTIIICMCTGLAIVLTGAWSPELCGQTLQGFAVTDYAFGAGIPFLPNVISTLLLTLCLMLFAFTTILGWDYYSERCLEYLSNKNMKAVKVFRWLYILAVFIGPYMTIQAVWTIADIFNGLMAIPNMIALIALSGVVVKTTNDYFKRLKSGEITDKGDGKPAEAVMTEE